MQRDNKKPSSAPFLWLRNPNGWMIGKPEIDKFAPDTIFNFRLDSTKELIAFGKKRANLV